MKWIGQNIYDLVSRFRDSVYLEDISTGTIASGGNLGLDSNNKIVKAAEATGDITSVVAGINITGGGTSGDVTLNVPTASDSTKGAVELATTAETTTGTDADRAVTPDGLKDGYQGSTNVVTVGTIATGVWNGTAINQTYLVGQSGTNTGDQTSVSGNAGTATVLATARAINGVDFDGSAAITVRAAAGTVSGTELNSDVVTSSLTSVGTIGTGVWQGTAIASAYLDADTAHLSTSKQCTYYMMVDDIDTTKIYIPLQTPDTETSVATNKQLRFLAPFAGKLLKVFLRANTNLSSNTLTWTLETRSTSSATSGTPTVVGTQSGAGCTNKTMTTYDFTSSLDSGDNIIDAGDTVQLAVQSDTATANSQFYITCLWEWNLG